MTDSTEIVVAPVEMGVLHASRPKEFGAAATEVANALAEIIESRKLYSTIQGRRYVRVEGWVTLAAMLGCLPREVSVVKHDDGGYTATVELARMSDGAILTRASAECGMDEKTWASRDAYARRSMAITRATSKACRIAYSWAIVLAGFEGTPSEEMPRTPSGVSEDGEIVLPGKPTAWGGNGGKPLSECPVDVLTKARDWLAKKDAQRNAQIIEAIEDELESRRLAGEGSDAGRPPARPEAREENRPSPPSTDKMPAALDEADELDALIASVERELRSAKALKVENGGIPEGRLAVIEQQWKMYQPVPTATQAEMILGKLEKAKQHKASAT